ncbi:enoyl-CoA delta isomerase 1, peroxisomal-like [Mizuhopecten yessoensis]|uniref:Enoyl-CoA delta isomerase 1, mitochondrial n=1 Tax=Mizuhopecten yessoensis TaxID=6573 RepID=A0A210R2G5_MIZYE|nr:enoyl-CoA delta isomerase 1, peroxisomal-like [Mizuhopecten yessoensis]OWF55134.1 Enoyl-CoA delta isomerase 1, mitochondrial [Mizuhopecten yessoensis]
MSSNKVSVEFTDDGFAILTMKNGENRLNAEFLEILNDNLDKVLRNKSCKALITTGEGKFYSNGVDLKWLMKQSKEVHLHFRSEIESLLWRMTHFPLPTVALLNGHAFAGGAFLAITHDYIVMNSKRGWFSMNETRVGLRIPAATREVLSNKMKNTNAVREAVLFARSIPGPEAKSLGLVDEIGELPTLMGAAKRLAIGALGRTGIDRDMLEIMKKDLYPRTVMNIDDKKSKL